MLRPITAASAGMLVIAAALVEAAEPRWVMVDIPDDVELHSVNAVGLAVGGRSPDPLNERAVYWTPTDGLVDLGTLGYDRAYLSDVNASGEALATAIDDPADPNGTRSVVSLRGYVRDPASWVLLPDSVRMISDEGCLLTSSEVRCPDGGSHAFPSEFSPVQLANGPIVAGAMGGPSGQQHAAIWSAFSGTQLIPGVSPERSFAMAVNNHGVVAGYTRVPEDPNALAPFVWSSSSDDLVILPWPAPKPPGVAHVAMPVSINDWGWLAVTAVVQTSPTTVMERAFVWAPAGGYTELSGNNLPRFARHIRGRWAMDHNQFPAFPGARLWTYTIAGDADGNCNVGLDDLLLVLGNFLICEGNPRFRHLADFDGSGCIDLDDLLVVLDTFGDSCDLP